MIQKQAKSEKNNGKKLTIPVKTRTPIEAFTMLRQGMPVDVAAAYYDKQGVLPSNFYMLDKTAKLHALADLRAAESMHLEEYRRLSKEIQSQTNINNNDKNSESAKANPTL